MSGQINFKWAIAINLKIYTHVFITSFKLSYKLVVQLFVNDHPSCGGAALASRANTAKESRVQGHIEIGVVVDEQGIVAAQFQQELAKSSLNLDTNLTPNRRAARERDQFNPLVLDQLLAHVRSSLAEIGDRRQLIALDHVRDDSGGGDRYQRGAGGSLPHDRVANR